LDFSSEKSILANRKGRDQPACQEEWKTCRKRTE
jgi:hypothetical protein